MFPVYIKFANELKNAETAVLAGSKVRKLDFVEDSLRESADAYASVLTNGFISTFNILAEKEGFVFSTLKVTTTLGIDKNKSGLPWLATADFRIYLAGVKSKNDANRFLQRTLESCLLLNSVTTEKHFQFDIIT